MKKNPHRLFRVIFASFALIAFAMPRESIALDKSVRIDSLMNLYHAYGLFNGSALVAENGKIIYKKGWGPANMDWNIPNAPDTKFRIGSITKQFAAMLIMQLVEKGKIKLEGKITDYLPDYRKDTGEKVTIHHLLTHTSGIPSYTGLPGFWSDSTRNPYATGYVVKNFCSGNLEFEPGSKYLYNNSGYYLLGAIIEKVTGKPFVEVLAENILTPLQMKNTGMDVEKGVLAKRAAGYLKQANGYTNEPYFFMQNAFAAGAMYSTVEDLYLWDQALYTDKLLTKKLKETMFTPYRNNYAYGWGVQKIPLKASKDSLLITAHTGGINGFNTIIFRMIADRHLVVLFNNTGPARLFEMSQSIANILYGKPFDPPKKSIAEALLKMIGEKNVEAAIAEYRRLKTAQAGAYDFGENELNTLGYQLLGLKKVKDAIEIFKLNVEAYPEAFNPYDSLGEAYMVNGDKELAIKNYAKSLELNPNNLGAIEMLKRIKEMK
jgi:CubicO group peptidase (beta-lactamase class C family)